MDGSLSDDKPVPKVNRVVHSGCQQEDDHDPMFESNVGDDYEDFRRTNSSNNRDNTNKAISSL